MSEQATTPRAQGLGALCPKNRGSGRSRGFPGLPEQPKIFAELCQETPSDHWRQRVRPGITDWAQMNQHYDSSIEDVPRNVAFDPEYVTRQSLLEDPKIATRTVAVVVFTRGASQL